MAGLVTGLALSVALVGWPALYLAIDHSLIQIERSRRFAAHGAGLALAGTPVLNDFDGRIADHGVKLGAPIFVQIFKREFELDLWMLRDGQFHKFATYPICRWSGSLGPKLNEGDRQAPEGFYTVDKEALNPQSRWHRSFNLGYPNAFDKAHERTGSFIMVHGGCSSVGCFAMTDRVVDEIWRIVTAALEAGQPRFQVQVFPFRMSEDNLARYRESPSIEFWRSLKPGQDLFLAGLLPPRVSVCAGKYAFEPGRRGDTGTQPIEPRCPSASATR